MFALFGLFNNLTIYQFFLFMIPRLVLNLSKQAVKIFKNDHTK